MHRLTTALADKYRIERELRAGGMATVYLAHDIKHDPAVLPTPSSGQRAASRCHRDWPEQSLGYVRIATS